MQPLLDGRSLNFAELVAVARGRASVAVAGSTAGPMRTSRDWVLAAARGELRDAGAGPRSVYGVNTGYGSLARVAIPAGQAAELSANLIRSHAAGTGPELPDEVVRAAMVLRANALARGMSGVEPAVVHTLLLMVEAGVTPVVPSRGSCGSSGDLAPLAHIGLVVFDGAPHESGRARFGDRLMTGAEAMAAAGITRVTIGPKDALAITNGAQVTTALTALAVYDSDALVKAAELATAMSFEALRGVTKALDPRVHALRPFRGAVETAGVLRQLLHGSALVDSTGRVQDAYALRCAPAVMGAVRDGIRFVASQVNVELNAVTDNPVIFAADGDGDAVSAGLFHGEPIGIAADHLRLVLGELAGIAERRVHRLTTSILSGQLPPGLAKDRGMGLMMTASTAASLVHTLRQTAWPASSDSIPTCEDQEDFVAMATTAARRARDAVGLASRVVGIELLCAAHGVRLRAPDAPSPHTGRAVMAVLDCVAGAPSHGEAVERLMERLDDVVGAAALSPWPGCLDV